VEAEAMSQRGDTKISIVSEEQAHLLAGAALDYDVDCDRKGSAVRLAARASAILRADFVILSGAGGSWSVVGAGNPQHPFAAMDARALFDNLAPGVAAVRRVAGEDWTLLTDAGETRVGLAIEGDWTLSSAPFFNLVHLVGARLEQVNRPASTSPGVARQHYRMMFRLARVSGILHVAETVLRHAASAVDARLGALAIAQAGDNRASIVATYGYPRALVEHVRIEPGAGVIGSVMASRRPVHASG
jgi:hypothetical protein